MSDRNINTFDDMEELGTRKAVWKPPKVSPTMNQGRKPKPKYFDPEKEWEEVKNAWKNDRAAWERYTGINLKKDGK